MLYENDLFRFVKRKLDFTGLAVCIVYDFFINKFYLSSLDYDLFNISFSKAEILY